MLTLRDRAVGQLVWLIFELSKEEITTRSLVRIQFPLQKEDVETQQKRNIQTGIL